MTQHSTGPLPAKGFHAYVGCVNPMIPAAPPEPTPDAAIAAIADELALMDGVFGPYELVLDWAKALPPLPAALQRDELLVPGCQSKVWLVVHAEGGRLWFQGDSDAPIVRGLVAMMLRIFSGRSAAEIAAADFAALERLDLAGLRLSMNRGNGVAAMARKIRARAEAGQQAA